MGMHVVVSRPQTLHTTPRSRPQTLRTTPRWSAVEGL